MIERRITDWDDAYANGIHIPKSEAWPGVWEEAAAAFREQGVAQGQARLNLAYGSHPRQRFDLFMPEGNARGLLVFVHGGYWMSLNKDVWSHCAQGALAHGLAVAIPSYRLCPHVSISTIGEDVAAAVTAAAEMAPGPIVLTGHSAGGQLVARLATTTSPLPAAIRARLARIVPISGVHDLRPLMATRMNGTLRIDAALAAGESPALSSPLPGTSLVCWVGGAERAEFLRQSALLANVWTGLGAATELVVEPDRHHFSILDGLTDPGHALVRALIAGI